MHDTCTFICLLPLCHNLFTTCYNLVATVLSLEGGILNEVDFTMHQNIYQNRTQQSTSTVCMSCRKEFDLLCISPNLNFNPLPCWKSRAQHTALATGNIKMKHVCFCCKCICFPHANAFIRRRGL